ncbi:MAG: amidohydrolase family protein [Clostridiales bacterium]|nr:amidohydrolase family protein [Clostridiales bacterium]
MAFDLIIKNAIILSSHTDYLPFQASVGVKDGWIVQINRSGTPMEGTLVVPAEGKILMPGLINGHCHGDMTLLKGLGDNLTLQKQNETFAPYGWFRRYLSDDNRFLSRQLTYCEALLSGTTFLAESMFWSLGLRAIDAMAETGIRGAPAENIRRDFSKPDMLIDDSEIETFISGCRSADLLPILVTIAEEDFNEERLKRIGQKMAIHGIRQTFHLAETAWRLDLIKRRFGQTSVAYLEHCGVLNENMIASHAVYLSDEEIELLGKRGVGIVNTPVAEMKLADGVAPIPKLLQAGLRLGLGTDGAMWNNSADLFREMKAMLLLHSLTSGPGTVTEKDVLDMATVGGASLFGLELQLGTIEVGKRADMILLDMAKPHLSPLRTENHSNAASLVVNCATGSDVTDVFVKGRRVVETGRLTTMDIGRLHRQASAVSERIAAAIGNNL